MKTINAQSRVGLIYTFYVFLCSLVLRCHGEFSKSRNIEDFVILPTIRCLNLGLMSRNHEKSEVWERQTVRCRTVTKKSFKTVPRNLENLRYFFSNWANRPSLSDEGISSSFSQSFEQLTNIFI